MTTTAVTALRAPGPAGESDGPGFLRTRALSESAVLITAFGEIDAANADELRDGIERHLGRRTQLVLDLSRLDFFGTAAYSVLDEVRRRCERTGVAWVLVPGPAVKRLLQICDCDGSLATAPNIVAAVAALTRRTRLHILEM